MVLVDKNKLKLHIATLEAGVNAKNILTQEDRDWIQEELDLCRSLEIGEISEETWIENMQKFSEEQNGMS